MPKKTKTATKTRPSLQQQLLVDLIKQQIKQNKPINISELAPKAGYSLISRNCYRKATREHIINSLSEGEVTKEKLKKAFDRIGIKAENKEDYTNGLRAVENISKLFGHFQTENSINVNINLGQAYSEVLKQRKANSNTQPIDIEKDKLT
jgi:hypothetical protein